MSPPYEMVIHPSTRRYAIAVASIITVAVVAAGSALAFRALTLLPTGPSAEGAFWVVLLAIVSLFGAGAVETGWVRALTPYPEDSLGAAQEFTAKAREDATPKEAHEHDA